MRTAIFRTNTASVTPTAAPLNSATPLTAPDIIVINTSVETIYFGDENRQDFPLIPNATFNFGDVFANEAEAHFSTRHIYVRAASNVTIVYGWVEVKN